ncbi:MAG: D-alanyl-D-alanine carboxypeptidase family protein [Solobacterium sp.]|nr:D-alanyl-D-alanine carboxypeptidase family protein [Solobacterium sp.]
MSVTITSEQERFRKYFVIILALFSAIMIGVLNFRYDSLSRYPYRDQQSRKKIKEQLTKEEIEYIIEYSIAPSLFINFIEADGFNIYHAQDYKRLSEVLWDKSPQEIVTMVESTRNDMSTDELIHYLQSYSFEELDTFLKEGDANSPGTTLIDNANHLNAYVNVKRTVGTHVPNNLVKVSNNITEEEMYLTEDAHIALNSMCNAINAQMRQTQGCGGFAITKAYVSYEDQEKEFALLGSPKTSYPGHDEHQLGLAVDLKVPGIPDAELFKTEPGTWLKENAWRFGFVQTYTEDVKALTNHDAENGHYRFVGMVLARMLHESGLRFANYSENY